MLLNSATYRASASSGLLVAVPKYFFPAAAASTASPVPLEFVEVWVGGTVELMVVVFVVEFGTLMVVVDATVVAP